MSDHFDRFRTLPEQEQLAVYIETTVEEGIQSSSIEGEIIGREDVRSSLTHNILLGPGKRNVKDQRAHGVARLMNEVISDPAIRITESTVLHWHKLLFTGINYPGVIGAYRVQQTPMQIVSGPPHREVIHFEAPPSVDLPRLMPAFFELLENPLPIVIRAGIGHVHFESLHPFADGNGRIGRAIMKRMLLEPLGGRPIISISQAIRKNRTQYYEALNQAQHTLDLTDWLEYFFVTLSESVRLAGNLLSFTIRKVNYFDRFDERLNSNQRKAVHRMWEAGPEGFQGGMTKRKYARLTRVAEVTASRHLTALANLGALTRHGSGRNTQYHLPQL